jgi:hypothetical protein
MKALGLALVIVAISLISLPAVCAEQAGLPIAFAGGCNIDLNGDGAEDTALLINMGKSYELIAIMRFKDKTNSYILNKSDSMRYLICKNGKEIKETDAGPGKKVGRIHRTNGAYLTLMQPESSEAAYFWSDGVFKVVWLSD